MLELLTKFESGLNPVNISDNKVQSEILGYGEISTVFSLSNEPGSAFKRMPLFSSSKGAIEYSKIYNDYCDYLKKAGINLPESDLATIVLEDRPVVLYIIQEKLSPDAFGHKIIHDRSEEEVEDLFGKICDEINRVWTFNENEEPAVKLAIDGQLSNWVVDGDKIIYIDTSTPLFRLNGTEQLDPELILKTAPGFLRWILRLFFLDDVMNRYYDPRSVFIDLAANLYKEQRSDLIPAAIKIINEKAPADMEPIKEKDVKSYYSEDKIIWALFLSFRKFDRWMTTKIFRKRYEFILPGKIKR